MFNDDELNNLSIKAKAFWHNFDRDGLLVSK